MFVFFSTVLRELPLGVVPQHADRLWETKEEEEWASDTTTDSQAAVDFRYVQILGQAHDHPQEQPGKGRVICPFVCLFFSLVTALFNGVSAAGEVVKQK